MALRCQEQAECDCITRNFRICSLPSRYCCDVEMKESEIGRA
jgi:hypothetical protein